MKFERLKGLWTPLTKEFYRDYVEGVKTAELRSISPRFNQKTVRVGRSVRFAKGYRPETVIKPEPVITKVHKYGSLEEIPDYLWERINQGRDRLRKDNESSQDASRVWQRPRSRETNDEIGRSHDDDEC